ncbi:hypothetical protein ND436_002790 [Neisseria gonorrhoeae]|nr:hypothetical protein [Neisseria gonorrhoeae]UYP52468.1 hypothetical protein ND436_002790 [Neisseria gonorrhoeae]
MHCWQTVRVIAVAIGTVVGLIAKFGDEIDVFGGGWSNLSDVIRAVWQNHHGNRRGSGGSRQIVV